MSNKVKIIMGIIVAIVLVAGGWGAAYQLRVKNYQEEVKNITITDIDVSTIPDGTYEGDCDVDFIYAKVKVIVKDGVIDKIDLIEHKNDRGGQAEKIVEDMIREQKITVDTVSGATNSSKVISKAVEKALEKPGK